MDADSKSRPTDNGLHPARTSARERTETVRRAIEARSGIATAALWSHPAGFIAAFASRTRRTSLGIFDGQSRRAIPQYLSGLQLPQPGVFQRLQEMVADFTRHDDELAAGGGLARSATKQCSGGARAASHDVHGRRWADAGS